MNLADRFFKHVNKTDSCWLWTASKNHKGYGQFGIGSRKNIKMVKAHRASWILHNGEIPEGLFVLHTCDIRHCVNPAHLFLGTNADNMCDMISKGRSMTCGWQSLKTHCPNGHEYTPENTYIHTDKNGRQGRDCRVCGNERQRQYRRKIKSSSVLQ